MGSHTTIIEILPENYRFLQEHVHSQVGIVLEDNKHYLFESRLAPIVKQHGLGSINDLCALLRTKRDVGLDHQVVEAMTTNETYFFRDPAQYEAIRTVLLPRLKEERARHQEPALLVGRVLHRAGSLHPCHAAAGERIRRIGTFKSWGPTFPRK